MYQSNTRPKCTILSQKSDPCRLPKILGQSPGPQETYCKGAAESLNTALATDCVAPKWAEKYCWKSRGTCQFYLL